MIGEVGLQAMIAQQYDALVSAPAFVRTINGHDIGDIYDVHDINYILWLPEMGLLVAFEDFTAACKHTLYLNRITL